MGDTTRTLYCGNLSSDVEDEILYELFLQAGPLEKVNIVKERDGHSKGFGFVTFKHECSVPYAIELMKGIRLFGRPLNLQNRTGSKPDLSNQYSRNPHHQRSASLQDHLMPPPGMSSSLDFLQSPVPGIAEFLSGNPLVQALMPQLLQHMMPQMPQNTMPPTHQRYHQRSRSYHGGLMYDNGSNVEDRRDFQGNSADRYYDRNSRDDRRDYNNGGDRQRSRDYDNRGRPRENDYSDRSTGSNYRGRDRERGRDRSSHRPYESRNRSRD